MVENKRYKVNKPRVVHENFGDEAVIINLDSGNYYSLSRTALDIWAMIEQGASIGDVAAIYGANGREVSASVERFVAELEREQLILPLSPAGENEAFDRSAWTDKKDAFEEPVISKYTDMQELLLLDPIHDVDESGWPSSN